jgi:hypothetical protein
MAKKKKAPRVIDGTQEDDWTGYRCEYCCCGIYMLKTQPNAQERIQAYIDKHTCKGKEDASRNDHSVKQKKVRAKRGAVHAAVSCAA